MVFTLKYTSRLRIAIGIVICVFAVALSGCATVSGMFSDDPSWESSWESTPPQHPEGEAAYRASEARAQPLSADEKAVLASARTLIGRAPESIVIVNGRTFVLDCILYDEAGGRPTPVSGGGVTLGRIVYEPTGGTALVGPFRGHVFMSC